MTNQNPDFITMPSSVTTVDPDLIREALEVSVKDTYTYQDLLDVASAEVEKQNFAAWVVERFYEEGEAGVGFEVVRGGGRPGHRVTVERPSGGWVSWSMQSLATPLGVQGLMAQGVEEPVPYVSMEKYTADDRGPGSRGPVVAFPLDVLFGERKQNAEYAEYLRLKAKFDGIAAPEVQG